MSLLAHVLWPGGLSHGRPPYFFLLGPGDVVPPSDWHVSFNPSQSGLPALAKFSSALSDLE
jgi:hypothetical protein